MKQLMKLRGSTNTGVLGLDQRNTTTKRSHGFFFFWGGGAVIRRFLKFGMGLSGIRRLITPDSLNPNITTNIPTHRLHSGSFLWFILI